ncbi:MAG: hypothetical protein M1840_000611 [Geoglossum simile]|nr:MAG: hypothetical protein M1840_000611 [Geoglossum simile]
MDITQWYAVALGALAVSSIVFCLFWFIIRVARTYATFYFLKHVFYPQVHKYLRGSGKTTRFDVILIIGFLMGNTLCVTIGVRNTSCLIKRTGLMSIINLMPLALGSHMNLVVNRCGLGPESYGRMHRWLGRVAIIEGFVHSTVAATSQKPDLHDSTQVAALIAVSAMAAILVSSSAIIRRHFYEVFLKLHLVLAIVVIPATWRHLSSRKLWVPPTIYLLVAACLTVSVRVLRLAYILYRNLRYKRPISRARVESWPDALIVHVKISRPWKFRAGQFVYLCIPGLGYSGFAQSHPFAVSWWYRDRNGNDFIVFIIQSGKGFTRNLLLHSNHNLGERIEMRTNIEGPYGKDLQLGSYSTVLLFATGVGIAGQLPYVKELLNGYYNCKVVTRKITLFWEIDSERGYALTHFKEKNR